MIFLKKINGNMIFSSNVLKRWSSQKNNARTWHFFFSKIRYFFRRKVKDDLSQKIHGNMMFSVYSVKMAFLFPTNMKLPFCQKSKDDLLWKDTFEDGIFAITEKDDAHPRKDDIGILQSVS